MSMKTTGRILVFMAAMALFTVSASAQTLVPGGQSLGVAVKTGGMLVVGASDIGTTPSPARIAGLKSGDIITGINGQRPGSAADIAALLDGNDCLITYERNGVTHEVSAQPVYDGDTGVYRLGVWVRDSAMGVGTLTFIDPESGRYGALGHAISDADAGVLLPVDDGAIYENAIVGIEKGRRGAPGEILGRFYDARELGDVDINSPVGIFGDIGNAPVQTLYPDGIDTMAAEDVQPGRATIISAVGEDGIAEYTCEILEVDRSGAAADRPITLKITDKRLIAATGGIVQGMSGSPILQDGKLVGAVTHVLVNDPTRGYGIFIENMLEAAK